MRKASAFTMDAKEVMLKDLFAPKVRKQSFEEVALKELPVLYRVARRMTLNDADAEDLVGQSLLLAARAWQSFDGRHARSWLIRILKNERLGALRKKRLEAALEDVEEPSEDGFWEEVSWRAVGEDILREVDKLPEEFRMAIALCDIEEMSYDEAAEAIEVPVGTVRSRLHRGRRILRARLARVTGFDMTCPVEEGDEK